MRVLHFGALHHQRPPTSQEQVLVCRLESVPIAENIDHVEQAQGGQLKGPQVALANNVKDGSAEACRQISWWGGALLKQLWAFLVSATNSSAPARALKAY
eukprot:scaffold978_cov392-Prasinococcus_capsulatus_cf.AAC.27